MKRFQQTMAHLNVFPFNHIFQGKMFRFWRFSDYCFADYGGLSVVETTQYVHQYDGRSGQYYGGSQPSESDNLYQSTWSYELRSSSGSSMYI